MTKPYVRRKDPQVLQKVYERLGKSAGREVAVGMLSGTTHPTAGIPVAELAAYHVFGIGVPERNFFEQARPGIIRDTRPLMKGLIMAEQKGLEREAQQLAEAAGMAGAEALKMAIIDGDYEPLAPATIARREELGRPSDKPLIDTGQMVNLISHAVRSKA